METMAQESGVQLLGLKQKRRGNNLSFLLLKNSIRVVAGVDQAGIRQGFHLGILNQMFGAHRCAQTAVVALSVVDDGKIVGGGGN